ncbi:MAG: Clp protease N-terminal domain-containing protein [Gaiellaceae bacterium]
MTAGSPSTARGSAYHPWTTYIDAREEARRRGDRKVGTEHLLLALLSESDLAGILDVTIEEARAALDALDLQAFAAIGLDARIDLPPLPSTPSTAQSPRRPRLRAVLKGRLPMTPTAKKTLEASRAGTRRPPRYVARDVLAALLELERPDPAAELLAGLGVEPAAIRERLAHV